MTTKGVKETLGNEGELLDFMILCTKSFNGSQFTKQGKFIHQSWGRFLGERRAANASLRKKTGAALKKDLASELEQVNDYIKGTRGRPIHSEQWGKFLRCEGEILKHLIDRC